MYVKSVGRGCRLPALIAIDIPLCICLHVGVRFRIAVSAFPAANPASISSELLGVSWGLQLLVS